MSENYKFFQNSKCEYYPCHKISEDKKEQFNCIFCYCPLNQYPDCGGNFVFLPNGIKDCSYCLKPHYNYDYIVSELTKRMYE